MGEVSIQEMVVKAHQEEGFQTFRQNVLTDILRARENEDFNGSIRFNMYRQRGEQYQLAGTVLTGTLDNTAEQYFDTPSTHFYHLTVIDGRLTTVAASTVKHISEVGVRTVTQNLYVRDSAQGLGRVTEAARVHTLELFAAYLGEPLLEIILDQNLYDLEQLEARKKNEPKNGFLPPLVEAKRAERARWDKLFSSSAGSVRDGSYTHLRIIEPKSQLPVNLDRIAEIDLAIDENNGVNQIRVAEITNEFELNDRNARTGSEIIARLSMED